jgi:hypothetical protein
LKCGFCLVGEFMVKYLHASEIIAPFHSLSH